MELEPIAAGYRSDVWQRQHKSGQQAALVRQIEVSQSQHHIQLFGLLPQTSVSRFSEMKQSLDHGKDMLYFGTYG